MVLINDIMDGARERPELFMGSKSITLLRSFLDGAVYTCRLKAELHFFPFNVDDEI